MRINESNKVTRQEAGKITGLLKSGATPEEVAVETKKSVEAVKRFVKSKPKPEPKTKTEAKAGGDGKSAA